MKHIFAFLFTFLFTTNFLSAQFTLTGKLLDENNEPVEFANVILRSAIDSTFIQGTTSDFNGLFSLNVDKSTPYFITISMIGFKSFNTSKVIFTKKNPIVDLGKIVLTQGGLQLAEVEVTAKKPIFEQKVDRTIINLENRVAAAGASALEILEQSPGVVVNRSSGTIGMLGKDGVSVMINGKLNYMPNDALLQFLGGLDANNIIKIELITTPSANLDAQGNAGFINIVLRNNPNEGLQGNYALTGGLGRGFLGNVSIGLNYRKGKINLFSSYTYTRNDQEQFTALDRIINNFQTSLTSEREPIRNNQNARLGLDYQIGKQTNVGILLSGYANQWDMNAVNTILQKSTIDTMIISRNQERNDWQHLQTNLNLSHQFKNKSTLTMDYDYLYYNNENPTTYNQVFSNDINGIFLEQNLFSNKKTPFNIQVGKVDYSLPFNNAFQFSIGGKYVQSDFENDVLVEENDLPLLDFTSKSNLNEAIFALYTTFYYEISKKLFVKGGLRYENTNTELNSTKGGKVIDRQFGSFFPSLFLGYKINSNNQFNLSYSRRINRPSFSDMAPFVIFLDPTTSFGGNSQLQPAIANTFQVNYRFKSINFSLQYTQEDSTIVRFQNRFNPNDNTQLIIPDNLREQQTFSATVAFPLQIKDWWNMRLFGIYTRQILTSIDELGIQNFTQNNLRINGSQLFNLPKNFNIELSGFYQTTSLNGNVKFKPQGVLNFGIQKKLKNNARLTFNINDIFNSLKAVGVTDLQNENIFVTRTFDFSQRTFKLTYSTTFGNQKMKATQSRNKEIEEKKRVN